MSRQSSAPGEDTTSRRHRGASGAPPRRRRSRRAIGLVAGTLLTFVAAVVYAAVLDLRVATINDYAAGTTSAGAIVEYAGADSEFYEQIASSDGTGVFEPFLRIQANDDESGYNTDGQEEFDTKTGTWTRAILLSEIPVVGCESLDGSETSAGQCWELLLDLNEINSAAGKPISLDYVEIYKTSSATITGYAGHGAGFTSGAETLMFADDTDILFNDVNQGTGRRDVRYLVPVEAGDIPADCQYGSTTCTTYFVVYSEMGLADEPSNDSDGGFEEWKVKAYPFVTVEKTAATTFTRTYAWTIEKSADPATWALFDGDTGTSDWTVDVTKDNGTDSARAVSGTITITNPSDTDAVIESVTDAMTGGLNATVTCTGATFPVTLEPDDQLVCSYSRSLPDGTSRTNTATVTLDSGAVFTDDAAVTFGAPTTVVNDTVDVTDTNGSSWDDISDDDSFTYPETFACGDDEGTDTNTATITQTNQSDSATVTVTCYDLDVTKSAVPAFSRDYDWTVDKSVDPATIDLFNGQSDDVEWTVTWTKGAAEDFGYAVAGSITITNNHPGRAAVINSVSDVISTAITATVDCGAGVTFPHTIAAGGSLVCSYSSALPNGSTRTNTATATQQHYAYASDGTSSASGTSNYTGTASVDFTGVTPTVTDDTATISDDRAPLDRLENSSGSTSYTETFECGDDAGTHTNNALVTETDSGDTDDDDATVTVNCYQLTVAKDATTAFTRDYDWGVAKTRVLASGETDGDNDLTTLTLDEGQTFTLTYNITVSMTGSTDSGWKVNGTITISNPAPIAANGVSVTDAISGGIIGIVDCDPGAGTSTTVNVPAKAGATNGTATCTYSADLPDGTSRTNTATASFEGETYDSTAVAVTFGATPTTQVDECVVVTDDNGTPANALDDVTLDASLCADEAPHTYTRTISVGPFATCGPQQLVNTAHIVTADDSNDTGENHDSTYTVNIDVPCPQGCTLTQGYWKTHNDSFHGGAPTDPTWDLLGPLAEQTPFFLSGQTYFQVFWTAPKGNAYYNLAHQYMAAQLNLLDGADGSAISTAFSQATALLNTYTPADIAKLKGKAGNALRAQFISLAGILGSYNEGLIGPGHCDEDAGSTVNGALSTFASTTVTARIDRHLMA